MLGSILYEDEYGAEPKDYGPHKLLLACVSDKIGIERHVLSKYIVAIPKKGNGNLKKTLNQDAKRLLNNGPVFVVFDEDCVRDCYGLTTTACKKKVLEEIQKHSSSEIGIVLLIKNTEDLLQVCLNALKEACLTVKPTPDKRDKIFNKVAAASPDIRAQICSDDTAFHRLVERVAAWIETLSETDA